MKMAGHVINPDMTPDRWREVDSVIALLAKGEIPPAQRLKTAYGWLHVNIERRMDRVNDFADLAISRALFHELLDWPDSKPVTTPPDYLLGQFEWARHELERIESLIAAEPKERGE